VDTVDCVPLVAYTVCETGWTVTVREGWTLSDTGTFREGTATGTRWQGQIHWHIHAVRFGRGHIGHQNRHELVSEAGEYCRIISPAADAVFGEW